VPTLAEIFEALRGRWRFRFAKQKPIVN